MLAAERGARRLLRPPRRPQPHLPLPRARPPRAVAVRARPRALVAVPVRRGRAARVRRRCCRARTTSPPSRPTDGYHRRFERDVLRAGWERDGDVLEFTIEADSFMRHMNRVLVGTMLEVAGGRGDAGATSRACWRAARARRPGRPRRRTGSTSSPCGLLGSEADAARAAHQRRRDRRRRACRRCAARCWSSTTSSSAVIAPDSNRSATARSITFTPPAVGHGGRLRGRHARLRLRRHAGRLRAARRARPDRRLRARPGRLGHQPRLQPRRRHHLLRDGRGGAGGHRARRAGDRGLPAVAGARDGLPARRALRLRARRPRSRRGSSTGSTTCRCPRARCSTSTCRPASPTASR